MAHDQACLSPQRSKFAAGCLVTLGLVFSSCASSVSGDGNGASSKGSLVADPVVTVPSEGLVSDLPQIVVFGKLDVVDDCSYLTGPEDGALPLVWPVGTEWDPSSASIMTLDGLTFASGDPLEIVGIPSAAVDQELLPESVRSRLVECAQVGDDESFIIMEMGNTGHVEGQYVNGGIDLGALNRQVKQFVDDYKDVHQLNLSSYGIGIDVREAMVVVTLSPTDRQRADVQQMESELNAFVDGVLSETEGAAFRDDVFEIAEGQMLPPEG